MDKYFPLTLIIIIRYHSNYYLEDIGIIIPNTVLLIKISQKGIFLSMASGYVLNFTPEVIASSKTGNLEYKKIINLLILNLW